MNAPVFNSTAHSVFAHSAFGGLRPASGSAHSHDFDNHPSGYIASSRSRGADVQSTVHGDRRNCSIYMERNFRKFTEGDESHTCWSDIRNSNGIRLVQFYDSSYRFRRVLGTNPNQRKTQ